MSQTSPVTETPVAWRYRRKGYGEWIVQALPVARFDGDRLEVEPLTVVRFIKAGFDPKQPRDHAQCSQQWRPIETAPKDGTEVLVWCDEGMDIARYSEREEDGVDSMGHDAGWWGIRQPMDPGRSMGNPDYTRPAENQPWAWMPQPEPPYDDEGERLFAVSDTSTLGNSK